MFKQICQGNCQCLKNNHFQNKQKLRLLLPGIREKLHLESKKKAQGVNTKGRSES